MRIAYLTDDDVNPDLAQSWASGCGCEVIPLSPRDPLPNGDYDAAIYDLDHLLPQPRRQVLTNLLKGPLHGPVVVHSYNLGQRLTNALRARGVIVRRTLERGTLLLVRSEICRIDGERRKSRLVELSADSRRTDDSDARATSYAHSGD